MVTLSNEESLLLLTCRPLIDERDKSRLEQLLSRDLDWSFILWRAETYQTIPLIEHHLRSAGLESKIPELVATYMRNWSSLSALRTVEQYRALGEIVNALSDMEVDYFLLKGAPLAALVYPDPLLRPMQDIDVMIPPHEAWRVQKLAYDLGYKHGVFDSRTGDFTHLFRRITRASLLYKHALHSVTKVVDVPSPIPPESVSTVWTKRQIKLFVNATGRVRLPIFVDFHVNLFPGMAVEDVWRDVSEVEMLERVVSVQSMTAFLWFSAARLYYEAFEQGTLKLQMMGDIDAIVRAYAPQIDWALLLTIAEKYEIGPALFYVFAQTKRLFSTPYPQLVVELLRPDQGQIPSKRDYGDLLPKLLSKPMLFEPDFA